MQYQSITIHTCVLGQNSNNTYRHASKIGIGLVENGEIVLNEAKFGPGDGPNWAVGRTLYPNFARVLAQQLDPETCSRMLKSRLALVRSKRAVRDTSTVPTQ